MYTGPGSGSTLKNNMDPNVKKMPDTCLIKPNLDRTLGGAHLWFGNNTKKTLLKNSVYVCTVLNFNVAIYLKLLSLLKVNKKAQNIHGFGSHSWNWLSSLDKCVSVPWSLALPWSAPYTLKSVHVRIFLARNVSGAFLIIWNSIKNWNTVWVRSLCRYIWH